MFHFQGTSVGICIGFAKKLASSHAFCGIALAAASLWFCAPGTLAQNVVTEHYDNARTGLNPVESILTPSNVNTSSFGKLFSQSVDSQIYAQPLYMAGLTIPGKGVHNVVFVATENDSVYAFDADNNGGANAAPLWQVSLLIATHGAGNGAAPFPATDVSSTDIQPIIGITSTPVIDPSTNTLYVVSATKEGTAYFQRLHALDVTSGAEKFGGPVALSGTVSGNGNGSVGGTLSFDTKWENSRSGLLFLNGFVYIAFGSHGDNGPWHGWILAYNGSTLKQTSVWCSSLNGIGAGIWMSGSGIAADTLNPTGSSPGGRLFIATGNGTFDATTPYTNSMDYGDSIVRLHLNNGVMTVADDFTPLNQSTLNNGDKDVASGGVMLLPDQTTGGHTHLLVQSGKEGRISLVDRDSMGGFSTSVDNIVEELPLNNPSNTTFPIGGLWGAPAYGNNTVYFWGVTDNLKSFPLTNGKIPSSAAHTGNESAGFPSPTPIVTSNGTSNPIVWSAQTDAFSSSGSAYIRAHDATNITTTLYNSLTNPARDTPGGAVKFVVPIVTNGKLYVGTASALSVFGLLNGSAQAATPTITPGAQSFTGTLNVTITDSTPGSSIFYSTTGTATTSSTPYTGPIPVSTTETISAVASAPSFLQSAAISETYTLQTQTLMPTFSPAPGAYGTAQTVTISDASPSPTIFYAINAPATTTSTPFTGTATVTVGQSETLNAIATSAGLTSSPQASATYAIGAGTGASFPAGFSSAASTMTFNGSTGLDDTRLQLTSGVANQAGSAWFNTPVNIQNFTNDFSFQLSNPSADGMTFTIQNTGVTALGPAGGGLGYGPDTPGGSPGIGKSVAIKFDIFDNDGEGPDSTGLYTNGVSPTMPSTNLSSTSINLHSGDTFAVHMVYNGTVLTMTITDGVTNGIFTTSFTVNIPSIVGANTAFVGFTGGTGGQTSSQKVETWSFVSGGTAPTPRQQATAPLFSPTAGTYSGTQAITLTDATPGSSIFYTLDKTTPGTAAGGSTLLYSTPISVATSETITALATASGFTTSAANSAAYVINATLPIAPTPIIAPGTGSFTSAQTVTITDSGATIFYTLDGSAPSTTSTKYAAPFIVSATTTVGAMATEAGFSNSATAQSVITINGSTTAAINFGAGFSAAGLQFNGHTKLNGTRLQLTDTTASSEAASAFWTAPVNVQAFTNDFTFQLTTPNADGFTFTVQNAGITALGPPGGGLGYGPDTAGGTLGIAKSVAVKFDLFNNAGEGTNSTGLYSNGASPTLPATTLGGGVNLHSGDILHAHMTYDGTTLTLTLTDTVNTTQTFTTSFPINIPSTVGGTTAFVGFTGGTGGQTAQQEIITWTYSASAVTAPKTPVVYQTANLPSASSGPTFRQIAWTGFPDGTGTILDATAVGDNVTLTVSVAAAGIADVKVSAKDLNTRGMWQLTINGTALGSPQDEYQVTASGALATLDLGNFTFPAAGNYAFKFTVTGKNAASSGFYIAFDDITLTPQ
jgi:Legume lectin domain/Chitobiase/beta-hexosaminidase C-terminal domain